jgi:hypothetical protein
VTWLSALLVLGTLGVIAANLSMPGAELRPGYQQMIHARVPWVLLGLLWAGTALGIAAVVRRRALPRIALLGLEIPLVGLASWYFLGYSFLPPHALRVEVGEPFPSYSLVDQDGRLQRLDAGTPREPALYIFYRGDW